jgi:hypothetical protein
MNASRWTSEDVERILGLYERGYPSREIAEMLGRTEASVRYKILSLGFSTRRLVCDSAVQSAPPPVPGPEPTVARASDPTEETILRARRELELGERRKEEREKVEDAKREILEERIVDEFRRTLCDLPRGFAFSPPPQSTNAATPLTAVLVVSDAHIGQVIDPDETEGLGNYNPAISLARIRHLELEASRILRERSVEKLLLLFGGDILHGQLGHTLEDDLTVPIALQSDLALNLFFPFVWGLSKVVPRIEIHGVAGNHGRWPGMRRMPTDRRWSNLDSILYGSLSALCLHSGLSNVAFDERISSRRQIDTGKFRLQLLHGDEVRGGNFCSGGMNREVHNSTLRNVQAGREAIDYYIMGDKHFSASVPYGTGAFIVNGSFVGVDGFGMNFLPAPPAQTLFFLHPQHGKTETHEIRLSPARLSSPPPYNLKPSLEALVRKYL